MLELFWSLGHFRTLWHTNKSYFEAFEVAMDAGLHVVAWEIWARDKCEEAHLWIFIDYIIHHLICIRLPLQKKLSRNYFRQWVLCCWVKRCICIFIYNWWCIIYEMCCRNMVVAFNKAANNGVAWIQVCFANLATLHAYLHEKDQALECAKQSKKKPVQKIPCRKSR